MADDVILVDEPAPRVRRITMNRPEKRNSLIHPLRGAILDTLREHDQDPTVSVTIIRGAGPSFSAGYDLGGGNEGQEMPYYTPGGEGAWPRHVTEGWMSIWDLAKPVIAQVHGYCLAGGTEFIGHCDIVFASEDAQFGHPAGRSLGILPTLSMWPVLMGPRKTKEYLFTGDYMGAKEALEWHLVNRVFPKDKLEEETLAYARRVAMVPAELLMLHKAAVNRYLDIMGIRAAEQSAADIDVIAHQTDTVKAWMKASREKGLKSALTERDRPFAKKS